MNISFKNCAKDIYSQVNLSAYKISNNKLSSEYYAEYFNSNFKNLSSLICFDSMPVGYIACCALDGKITWPGGGVLVKFFNEKVDIQKKDYLKIVKYLSNLADCSCCHLIEIRDNIETTNTLSVLSELLLMERYVPEINLRMMVPFTLFTPEQYFGRIRRSYKSLVNWGKKNLNITYVNKDNLDKELFFKFKDFHAKISGRITRSDKTWELQYEMVSKGYGELILGYYNSRMAAGSLFIDQDYTSIYFTGVYDRKLFGHGISHFLLYDGVCRSYKRGNANMFCMGNFDPNTNDKKLWDIQFFKKGFCEQVMQTFVWRKQLSEGF